ncbi:4'-phosphopantetheinyl transferase family protein [Niabella insulamsoli]|uniref:4'-phosphopantetheinyl transferase family protein n=1 Tax=Niabella insulamsoli TaxID=3144874 RepID=UPI0031FBC327
MPVFYKEEINSTTHLGIWHITEEEAFFKKRVPQHRDVTHAHKRLQHLAGRFLLKFLVPDFPSEQIKIADTKKPFLADEAYHFSISHCADYAAAIVSSDHRVGIDIELPSAKVAKVRRKFISDAEEQALQPGGIETLTQLWSAKEAVFKWYGEGQIDFKQHIQLKNYLREGKGLSCYFAKTDTYADIHIELIQPLCLSYVCTPVQ